MTTGNRQADLNLETRLKEINLSPVQRNEAIAALRAADDIVEVVRAAVAGVKRITGVFSLRPSVRA
jgi:hypothetical protein